MSFWQKIKQSLRSFMMGRNGADHLGLFTVWTAIALDIVNMFVKNDLAYGIIGTVSGVLVFWALFRMFSKNLAKRRAENAKFLQKVWWPIKGKLHRMKDKDHKYFTCPTCRTVCRVPRGKGKIVITCPKCRGRIEGKS